MKTPPIQPISKDELYLRVAEAIGEHIRIKELQPGSKLSSERQLSALFVTGRNTVRKALQFLSNQGVLELIPNRGAFVRKIPLDESLDLQLIKVDYHDLLEMKMWLEQLAIRRAAERADSGMLKKLELQAQKMQDQANQGIYSVEQDHLFHKLLLSCAGSETLSQIILALIDALNSYISYLQQADNVWVKTVPFHLDISKALKKKQINAALAAHEYIYMYDLEVLDKLSNTTEKREQ